MMWIVKLKPTIAVQMYYYLKSEWNLTYMCETNIVAIMKSFAGSSSEPWSHNEFKVWKGLRFLAKKSHLTKYLLCGSIS